MSVLIHNSTSTYRALRKLIGGIIIFTIAVCYQAEKKKENYDI